MGITGAQAVWLGLLFLVKVFAGLVQVLPSDIGCSSDPPHSPSALLWEKTVSGTVNSKSELSTTSHSPSNSAG